MPGMSGSGNMIPQSRTTMRPSSSMHAQLRPISPRPPRKMMRTGSGKRPARRGRRQRRARRARGGESTSRAWSVELGGAAPSGSRHWPAGRPRHAARRLGRQRVRVGLARLEVVGLEQPGVERAAPVGVALERRRPPSRPISTPAQCDGHAHRTDGAHGQQGQGQGVVAAVDLEPVGGLGRRAGPSRRGRRRRLSRRRCWARRGPGRSMVSRAILRPARTGMS